MKLSTRMDAIQSNVLSLLEDERRKLLAQGGTVINLSAGTPDLPPDDFVMQTLSRESLDPENYKYAIKDSVALLDAAARWYDRRFDVTLEREQIMSVYGSQEGLAHICFPLCNPGDIVLVPDPGYPIFHFGPCMSGAELYHMPLRRENGFLPDLEAIPADIAHRAKVMIISYPNNPTTARANPEFYERVVAFAKKYDIFVIHDNAYSELLLDGSEGASFLQTRGATDVGVEFNSLSKSYNLTGMRTSFILGNRDAVAAMSRFRSQFDYGPFPAIQKTVIAVLDGPQDILERNRREYRLRRDALCKGLRAIGWAVPDCENTMFTWFPLPAGVTDDVEFVFRLCRETGVICVPGASFGEMGRGFVRFALVAPVQTLDEAVRKIDASGILKGLN